MRITVTLHPLQTSTSGSLRNAYHRHQQKRYKKKLDDHQITLQALLIRHNGDKAAEKGHFRGSLRHRNAKAKSRKSYKKFERATVRNHALEARHDYHKNRSGDVSVSTSSIIPERPPKVEQVLRCIVPYKAVKVGDSVTLIIINGDVGTLMTTEGRVKIDLDHIWEFFRPLKGHIAVAGIITHARLARHNSAANDAAVKMEQAKLKAATIGGAYKLLRVKNAKSKKVLEKLHREAEKHRLDIQKHQQAMARIRSAAAIRKAKSKAKSH